MAVQYEYCKGLAGLTVLVLHSFEILYIPVLESEGGVGAVVWGFPRRGVSEPAFGKASEIPCEIMCEILNNLNHH